MPKECPQRRALIKALRNAFVGKLMIWTQRVWNFHLKMKKCSNQQHQGKENSAHHPTKKNTLRSTGHVSSTRTSSIAWANWTTNAISDITSRWLHRGWPESSQRLTKHNASSTRMQMLRHTSNTPDLNGTTEKLLELTGFLHNTAKARAHWDTGLTHTTARVTSKTRQSGQHASVASLPTIQRPPPILRLSTSLTLMSPLQRCTMTRISNEALNNGTQMRCIYHWKTSVSCQLYRPQLRLLHLSLSTAPQNETTQNHMVAIENALSVQCADLFLWIFKHRCFRPPTPQPKVLLQNSNTLSRCQVFFGSSNTPTSILADNDAWLLLLMLHIPKAQLCFLWEPR